MQVTDRQFRLLWILKKGSLTGADLRLRYKGVQTDKRYGLDAFYADMDGLIEKGLVALLNKVTYELTQEGHDFVGRK